MGAGKKEYVWGGVGRDNEGGTMASYAVGAKELALARRLVKNGGSPLKEVVGGVLVGGINLNRGCW